MFLDIANKLLFNIYEILHLEASLHENINLIKISSTKNNYKSEKCSP